MCIRDSSIAASSTVDYNAMAAALKQLNLFRGTLTGYGEGYDLELAPTRLQALITVSYTHLLCYGRMSSAP